MNNKDFDTILLESSDHTTLDSFFKAKRQDYRCTKKEFEEGMKRSIKRIEELYFTHCNEHFEDNGEGWLIFCPHGKVEILEDPYFSIELYESGRSYLIGDDEISYFTERIEKYFHSDNKMIERKPDHTVLYGNLLKYLPDIKLKDFSKIINTHALPNGAKKAKWTGTKAEARYFADVLKMDIPTFNKCFDLKDGTLLRYNDNPTTKKLFKKFFNEYQ